MTAHDLAREALELAGKATGAPWILGDVWRWAGVMPERYGDGKCAFCRTGEPTWVGRAAINGEMMLAHRHRYEGEQDRHSISGPEDGLVAGNYDYDTGGIVLPVDAAFICFARTALPALAERCLALEGAIGDVLDDYDCGLLDDYDGDALVSLRRALAAEEPA